ncbi:MAG: hypothetical protein H6819_02125 [Phycisphaerales bacterium]|nr:hypothetical protein [Phycisphaerales bacterium]MCB9856990.1 hypothetical protein [Phycisphaerales bacterium]MCB9861883.1 hypothetical protein [Phycisphaerales bacterium]
MSLRILRKIPLLIVFAILGSPALARAQLSLGNDVESRADYRRRAQQFMLNQSLSENYRDRIRSNTLLFGQRSNYDPRNLHTRPLILSGEYGLLNYDIRPMDQAGRWLSGYRLLELRSEIANTSINLPQSSDIDIDDTLVWTTEEVLAALRRSHTTELLSLDDSTPKLGAADRMEIKLENKADESFRDCAASFRAALETNDREKQNALIAEARSSSEIVIQIDFNRPRGYLAEALIAYKSGNFNTALVSLELGIRRADTWESLEIDREAFFGQSRDWDEMLDTVSEAARSTDSPRIHLLQAYFAFLNGDFVMAQSSVDKAIDGLKKQMRESTPEDEIAEENAGYKLEASIEYAEHFKKLIADKQNALKGAEKS